MEIVKYDEWTLEVDVEATLQAYAETPVGGSDECTCTCCQDFKVIRDRVYPDEFLALLKQLGIDYTKDVEVAHITMEEKGKCFYMGWFDFIGVILAGDVQHIQKGVGLQQTVTALPNGEEPLVENFRFYFSEHLGLSHPLFHEHTRATLQFNLEIPLALLPKTQEYLLEYELSRKLRR